ncbi:DUF721 domain-containing protein [Candidatus Uhrbacteria bacterium]|nr:DUF721 domain-containing protein [Candidatus Uhrbacteria bacterium]
MQQLKDILKRHMPKTSIGRQLEANQVLHAAEQVIGSWFNNRGMPAQVRGEYFKQGAVFVSIGPAPAVDEIRLHQKEFLAKMNEQLGRPVVKRIQALGRAS